MTSTSASSSPDCGRPSMREYRAKAAASKVLMVGAGGIGCELLKNLVLAGFQDMVIIDLDTIDVTNLNRQFLFQKQHVGKSKSQVARESVLRFNSEAKIEALHDSVMSPDYGVDFFKKFDLVMNALDNRAARSHVNRMCLAADVPLVESGTAGYLGQVTVIRKRVTECYECTPKPHQKTFPGCTIRNTPSEPIHCIVWAKHLFNQLFGETDPDEEVSPDTEDPEAKADNKDDAAGGDSKDGEKGEKVANNGNVTRISTRQWAQDQGYDPKALFTKFFFEDIKYLLTMDKLWSKRKAPVPLEWSACAAESKDAQREPGQEMDIKDQAVWDIHECTQHFAKAIDTLKNDLKKLPENDHLVWDKDDEAAMTFVTACANIRAEIFHIGRKSRFDIKSMAGNIIPAIATTNAVIGGLIVLEALKLLMGQEKNCKTTFLTRKPNPRHKILVPCQLNPPNPKCYVCPDKPEVSVKLSLSKMTLKTFEEKILKGSLHMVAPDVEVEGKGVILISSEEGETTDNMGKTLESFNLASGTILTCDDFLQNYSLKVFLFHTDKLEDDVEFEIISDISKLKAEGEEEDVKESPKPKQEESEVSEDTEVTEIVMDDKTGDDRKRKAGGVPEAVPAKKVKSAAAQPEVQTIDDDDCVTLD